MIDYEITERIIGCAYRVINTLGCGFLEKVYENALLIELDKVGLNAESQKHIDVYYEGIIIGEYIADLIVENRVIIELKSVEKIASVHKAQLLNYLSATRLKTGLLLNFGNPTLEIKRLYR